MTRSVRSDRKKKFSRLGVAETYADIGRYVIRPLNRSSSRVLVVGNTKPQRASSHNYFITAPHLEHDMS